MIIKSNVGRLYRLVMSSGIGGHHGKLRKKWKKQTYWDMLQPRSWAERGWTSAAGVLSAKDAENYRATHGYLVNHSCLPHAAYILEVIHIPVTFPCSGVLILAFWLFNCESQISLAISPRKPPSPFTGCISGGECCDIPMWTKPCVLKQNKLKRTPLFNFFKKHSKKKPFKIF